MNAITRTDFTFEGQKSKYVGKVRDVYDIDDKYLVMVVTDRISAFDVVLPEGIPYKGQVLNQIAAKFLDATADILPNWKLAVPDPMVTVGRKCEPYKVEMVIRGYLSGHAWREYKAGKRTICGVEMPEGMVENQRFPEPIITPTSKAAEGHDEDISKEEIIASGLVSREEYEQLERYTRAIYQRGSEIAARMGLILVDTKYEFGKKDGVIYLMDEIHTPDSSRYFYAEGYEGGLPGRAAKAAVEGVCPGVAHGQRIPGTGRAAGSRNDAPDRSRHHRPLCRGSTSRSPASASSRPRRPIRRPFCSASRRTLRSA